MIATHMIRDARQRRRRSAPTPHRAFTLTELLVVIALIVLLVGLLLAALSQVQTQSKRTSTLATMQAFRNACDAFQQEHGFYPGVVPEDILANDPRISGTENALLHLMGGFVRRADDEFAYTNQGLYPPAPGQCSLDGWHELKFTLPPPQTGTYDIKFSLEHIGEGPIINGKPFAPYLTPGARELGVALGQPHLATCSADPPRHLDLPDLLDAWGQPIIYLRRQRTIGPITFAGNPPPNPQFATASMTPYTNSISLGKLGASQMDESIFNLASDPVSTLGKILGHPALSQWGGSGSGVVTGQARGAFMLLSAGPDGVYFSQEDGAGNPNQPQPEILDLPASIIEEYDDMLLFGGD